MCQMFQLVINMPAIVNGHKQPWSTLETGANQMKWKQEWTLPMSSIDISMVTNIHDLELSPSGRMSDNWGYVTLLPLIGSFCLPSLTAVHPYNQWCISLTNQWCISLCERFRGDTLRFCVTGSERMGPSLKNREAELMVTLKIQTVHMLQIINLFNLGKSKYILHKTHGILLYVQEKVVITPRLWKLSFRSLPLLFELSNAHTRF